MSFERRGSTGPRRGRGGDSSARGGFRGGPRRGGTGRPGYRPNRGNGGMSDGGNFRERISVESGHLVLIDQFMLANTQFLEGIKTVGEDPEAKDPIINKFGGLVIDIEPGIYKIDRDPFNSCIVIFPDGESVDNKKKLLSDASISRGEVLVDTRCVAMIDRELLDDSELLAKYQRLWFEGQDKACRDLIRDNGGAVRYGFQKTGEELNVKGIPGKDVVCLWAGVVQEEVTEEAFQAE